MKAMPAESWTRSHRSTASSWTSHIRRSTSRSFERHTALSLVGPRALLVRLRRRGLQREEDDLREPLADWQLEDVGAAVQRAEGEGPGEAGIDHAEGRQDPPAGPGRPKPELARDMSAETDGLAGADREPSRRRDSCDPLSRPGVRRWDED